MTKQNKNIEVETQNFISKSQYYSLIKFLKNKEKVYKKLLQQLNQLKVELTPKKEFEQKYKYYKKNWPKLIK